MKDRTDTTNTILLIDEKSVVDNMALQMNRSTSSDNYYVEEYVPVEGA